MFFLECKKVLHSVTSRSNRVANCCLWISRLSCIFIVYHNEVVFFRFGAESEKFHEMTAATTPPEKDGLKLDDDLEFPPVTLNNDWDSGPEIPASCVKLLIGVQLTLQSHFELSNINYPLWGRNRVILEEIRLQRSRWPWYQLLVQLNIMVCCFSGQNSWHFISLSVIVGLWLHFSVAAKMIMSSPFVTPQSSAILLLWVVLYQ